MVISASVLRALSLSLLVLATLLSGVAAVLLAEYLTVNVEVLHLGPDTPLPTVLSYVEVDNATFGESTERRARSRGGSSLWYETQLLGAREPFMVQTRWRPATGMSPPGGARGIYRPHEHRLELERDPQDARGYAFAVFVGLILAAFFGALAVAAVGRPGGLTADLSSSSAASAPGGYRVTETTRGTWVKVRASPLRRAAYFCLFGFVALTIGAMLLLIGRGNVAEGAALLSLAPVVFVLFFGALAWGWIAPASLVAHAEGVEISRLGRRQVIRAPWQLEVRTRHYNKGGTDHAVGVVTSGEPATFRVFHHTPDAAEAQELASRIEGALRGTRSAES